MCGVIAILAKPNVLHIITHNYKITLVSIIPKANNINIKQSKTGFAIIMLEPYIVRGRILEAAIKLEGNFDLIISKYFCNFDYSYNEFISVVLHSREFTFNLKKEVFLFILYKHFNEDALIKRFLMSYMKKGQKIDGLLTEIISVRNKISHQFSVQSDVGGEEMIAFFVGTHRKGITDVKYSDAITISLIEDYEKSIDALVELITFIEDELLIQKEEKG